MLKISEAAIRLGDDAAALIPGQPWADIRGLGNWLRHAYDRIEAESIWQAVKRDLPPLRMAIAEALERPEPSANPPTP